MAAFAVMATVAAQTCSAAAQRQRLGQGGGGRRAVATCIFVHKRVRSLRDQFSHCCYFSSLCPVKQPGGWILAMVWLSRTSSSSSSSSSFPCPTGLFVRCIGGGKSWPAVRHKWALCQWNARRHAAAPVTQKLNLLASFAFSLPCRKKCLF